MLKSFLQKYWLQILPWILATISIIWLAILLHKPAVAIQPPIVDHRADSLARVVSLLDKDLKKSRHAYDSLSTTTRTDIKIIRIQNAKEISHIRSFTTAQRDSVWATIKP